MTSSFIPPTVPTTKVQWLNERQVAERLQVSVSMLRQDRFRHRGLPYAKFRKSVRYDIDVVDQYMRDHTITPNGR